MLVGRVPHLVPRIRKTFGSLLLRIMQFPRHGIEESDETGLADSPSEQGIGC